MSKINIGGKERSVKFNFNALEELDEMGFDILNGSGKLKSIKFIKSMAFVGLKYGADDTGKDPDFTLKDVGAWLTNEHIKQFLDILNKKASEPSEKPGESLGAA